MEAWWRLESWLADKIGNEEQVEKINESGKKEVILRTPAKTDEESAATKHGTMDNLE